MAQSAQQPMLTLGPPLLILALACVIYVVLRKRWYTGLLLVCVFILCSTMIGIGFYFLSSDETTLRYSGIGLLGLSGVLLLALAMFTRRFYITSASNVITHPGRHTEQTDVGTDS